jgi:uncharacterized membrane protein HdeD (DUF308 family)
MTEQLTPAEMGICKVKWGGFAFLGILGIIFGILMILYPQITTLLVVVLFGVIVLILALLALIAVLQAPVGAKGTMWLLLGAVLGFIFGIACFVVPQVIAGILTILIAIALFIIGILYMIWAITEKMMAHRWLLFLIGLLSFIFAILFLIYPLIGAIIIFGVLVGIYFLIYGILSLIAGLMIRKYQKQCTTKGM